MRWPFGRKSSRGAGPPAAIDAAPAAVARPDAAWRSLPAIQRAIGDPPVVAPAAPFAAALATRQPPGLALEALGHEVSPLAAPGVLIGLAGPPTALNSGRLELPVQRATQGVPAAHAEAPGWSSFDEPWAEPLAGSPATPEARGRPTAELVDSRPAGAPAVQRSTARATLTSSSATSVDVAPAGRLDLRPASAAPLFRDAGPASPAVQAPVGAPVQRAQVAAPPEPPIRRPTLGEARRLGLGAPLRTSDQPRIQRIAATEGPDGSATWVELGAPGLPVVRSAALGSPSAGAAPGAGDGGEADAPAGLEPDTRLDAASASPGELPVVRPISIQRLAPLLPGADLSRVEELSLGGPARVGELPSERAATLRRDDDNPGPGSSATDSAGLSAGLGAPVQRDAAISAIAPLRPAPIRNVAAGSHAGPASDFRAPAGPERPAGRPQIPVAPVVARSIAGPVGPSAAPSPGPAGRLERGGLRSEPVGPLAQPGPIPALPTSPDPSGAQPGRPAPDVPVQRAVEVRELAIGGQGGDRPAAGAQPNGTGEPAAGAAPISAADRDRELDELARRLYGRIRSRLTAELLADRERAGLLVDLR